MISRARMRANRANARRSTGPKTCAGKKRSAQNATKHGFRSKVLTTFLNDKDHEALLYETLGDRKGEVSVSAKRMVFETQAALRSIDDLWDDKMAHLHDRDGDKINHDAITMELKRLSLYAQRIRSLQRKAINEYLIQSSHLSSRKKPNTDESDI